MITSEKIKIYDFFDGDEDAIARIGKQYQNDLFDKNDDWFHIKNFYQDLLLINNSLASDDYIFKAVNKMKLLCDAEAYAVFISKII